MDPYEVVLVLEAAGPIRATPFVESPGSKGVIQEFGAASKMEAFLLAG